MALTKVTNDLQDALAAAQPTITSTGTLTGFTSTGIDDNATSTAITITSDEKVGIGINQPTEMLEIYNTSSPAIQLNDGGDYKSIMRLAGNDLEIRGSSGSLEFYTGSADGDSSSERMRIDSAGNVGIGNSIASSFNAGANNLVIGTGSGSEGMTIYGGGESNIFFADGTAGSAAYVGRIEYSHSVDNMLFYVNNSNVMTIANDGKIQIGNNVPMWSGSYGGALFLKGNNSTADRNAQLAVVDSTGAIAHNGVFINNNGAVLMKNNTSDNVDTGYGSRQDMDGSNYCTIALNNGTHYVRADSAWKFYVMGNGQIHSTSQSISGISDVRLKENITDIDTGLAEIMALQPRRFDWKDGGGTVLAGFVAQEVESVLPDLIGNFKHDDFEDAKSLRMGDILPTLVKAMQEQQAIIESLTARLEALEGE